MDKGVLDASVGVTMEEDKDGYVDLYIGIDEEHNPLAFLEKILKGNLAKAQCFGIINLHFKVWKEKRH